MIIIPVMPLVGLRVGFSPPGIWESVHPILTMGADYTHHIIACPPGFENLAAYLNTQASL